MRLGKIFVFVAMLAAVLPQARADEKDEVLRQLDAAAKDFKSVTVNVEFDTIETVPIKDTDVMTGVAYYERDGKRFKMAAHLTTHNGAQTAKTYIFSEGKFRISETGKEKDAQTIDKVNKYESYLMLGFGASGSELKEKWEIKYLGKEKIGAVVADKLELIAKDPDVRKNIPKVTIWMDSSRAVSLKQVFDEGNGASKVCDYSNIKVNQKLPNNAFSFNK
jgi:outer membrane lipoprotein-sorting protein